MKKITIHILAIFLMAALGLEAQSWNTVGNGLSTSGNYMDRPWTTTANGDLYVAYSKAVPSSNTREIKLKKWNGLSWSQYPDTVVGISAYLTQLASLNGEVYLGTNIGLLKLNGNGYTVIDSQPVHYLKEVNNQLLVRNYRTHRLYDGNSFNPMAQPPNHFSTHDAEYFNGEYYISGHDSALFNSPVGVLKLDNGTWVSPVNFFDSNPAGAGWWQRTSVFTLNGNLYSATSKKLYELSNDTAHYIGPVCAYSFDEIEYNGEMYLLGDSTYMPNGGIYTFDGNTASQVVNEPEEINTGVVYNGELYAFSSRRPTYNGITYNNAYRLQGGFSVLNGTVYMDDNSDCFYNSNEVGVPHFMVAMDTNDRFVTNNDGFYSYGVQPGTYSFDTLYSTHSVGKNLSLSCNIPSSLNIGTSQTLTQDIAVENAVSSDMQTFITGFNGWRTRYGFTEAYRLDVSNTGNSTEATTTATLEVPSSLSVVSVDPAPSSVAGNIYTFDFLNIQPLETRRVDITVKIDTSTNSMGDTLVWNAHLSPIAGDADLSDNSDTLTQTVVGAYDPNDKQASAYRILPGTERIDYHIRFQNTGTDTAYKVTVVDTLDLTLPITRIVINSASHPYSLSVEDNILIWEFDNILLPDSTTDLAGSQGYVRFSAGINSSLGIGDTIENDAEIYFDYQVPIHTNFAKTAIVSSIGQEENPLREPRVEIFPNPAQNDIFIRLLSADTMNFKLLNMSGQVLDVIDIEGTDAHRYSIQTLPKGVYLLKSETETFRLIVQ